VNAPGYPKPSLSEAQIWLMDYLAERLGKMGYSRKWVVAEHRFCEGRKWQFDVAIPQLRIAFEADGGKWHGGHRRGKALEDDYERQNTAIMEGWRVLRFTNQQILCGKAKEFLEKYL